MEETFQARAKNDTLRVKKFAKDMVGISASVSSRRKGSIHLLQHVIFGRFLPPIPPPFHIMALARKVDPRNCGDQCKPRELL